MRAAPKTFEDQLADTLGKASVPFRREVALGGHVYDFAIQTLSGPIFVEAKSWPTLKNKYHWATRYAEILSKAAKGHRVLLVIRGLSHTDPSKGLVNEDQVAQVLRAARLHDVGWSIPTGAPRKMRKRPVYAKSGKMIFAAMPFSPEYYDVYALAMAPVAEKVGAVCKRVDEEDFAGDIPREIKKLIRRSIAVVADLSESKPDVLYEVGYAQALNRKTVQICSTDFGELPMTVRNRNTIRYSRTRIYELKRKLERRLKRILETN